MSTFTATPYSLSILTTILVEVRAHNSRGWSSYSTPNTVGATVKAVPNQMSAPTKGTGTNENTIIVQWNAIASPVNGDSAVTTYNL